MNRVEPVLERLAPRADGARLDEQVLGVLEGLGDRLGA